MTLAGEPDSCAAAPERTDDDESALGEVGKQAGMPLPPVMIYGDQRAACSPRQRG